MFNQWREFFPFAFWIVFNDVYSPNKRQQTKLERIQKANRNELDVIGWKLLILFLLKVSICGSICIRWRPQHIYVIHYEFALALDGFHLPSLQHIRVPKTMKWPSYLCPKLVICNFHSILIQTFRIISLHQYIRRIRLLWFFFSKSKTDIAPLRLVHFLKVFSIELCIF